MCGAEEETRQLSFTQQQAQFMEAKGILLSGTPLYLDMQATTPMDPRVLDKMLPFMTEQYGNPHSRTHYYGWESEDAVEVARKQVRLLSNDAVSAACSLLRLSGLALLCTDSARRRPYHQEQKQTA